MTQYLKLSTENFLRIKFSSKGSRSACSGGIPVLLNAVTEIKTLFLHNFFRVRSYI